MTKEELIESLQNDLRNERKHLAFYTQASVLVAGLHREELREFLEEEAKGELQHVIQFSEAIVHLGGMPLMSMNSVATDLSCPMAILKYAAEMENEVADIYAQRLRETEDMENSDTAYVHVFYENQIEDSWKTAKEIEQMIKTYDHQNETCK